MNRDIKAIVESYSNLGINHTTTKGDSFRYAPAEYSTVRNENEETSDLKKRIALELDNMTKRSARGLKEDYLYIATNIKRVLEDVGSIIGKI